MRLIYTSICFLLISINEADCFTDHCQTSVHSIKFNYQCTHARIRLSSCYTPNYSISCNGTGITSAYTSELSSHVKSITFNWTTSLQIPPLAFSEYFNLVTLDITYGLIKELQSGAFGRLNHLEELRLTNHALKKIPIDVFNSLSLLKTLNLTSNKLDTIEEDAFLGLTNLTHLYISHNNISNTRELDNVCETLVVLDLAYNEISTLTSFRNFQELKVLYLNNNKITEISCNIFANISLRILNLQDNFIKQMDSNAFSELSTLVSLNLASNDLYYFKNGRFPIGLFRNNKFLESLNVSKTNLNVLPVGAFTGLEHLVTLDLSHNNLGNLPKANFHSLKYVENLYINNNYLRRLEYDRFWKLQAINLNNNPWNCDSLSSMLEKIKEGVVIQGYNSTSTNILGIGCSEIRDNDYVSSNCTTAEDMQDIISNMLSEQYQNYSTETIHQVKIIFKELVEMFFANFTTSNLAHFYMPNSTNMQEYDTTFERFETYADGVHLDENELDETINNFSMRLANNSQKWMSKDCSSQNRSHFVTVLLSSVFVTLLIVLIFTMYMTYILMTMNNVQKCQISQLPLHDYRLSETPLLQNEN